MDTLLGETRADLIMGLPVAASQSCTAPFWVRVANQDPSAEKRTCIGTTTTIPSVINLVGFPADETAVIQLDPAQWFNEKLTISRPCLLEKRGTAGSVVIGPPRILNVAEAIRRLSPISADSWEKETDQHFAHRA